MLHVLGLAVPARRLASILKEQDAWQEEQTLMWKRELEVIQLLVLSLYQVMSNCLHDINP